MLAFTPAVERALRVFDVTHAVQVEHGVSVWQRVALPAPGHWSEQDALVMEAMDFLLRVHNSLPLSGAAD